MRNWHKIQLNVFVVEQHFVQILAKIITVNQAALIEISCKKGQLIKNIRGLSIFIITLDCSFNLNGMQLVEANPFEQGFQPQLIYIRNETLTKANQAEFDAHAISNSSVLGILVVVFVSLYAIVCVKISYTKKSEQNYTIVREPKPDTELTIMN